MYRSLIFSFLGFETAIVKKRLPLSGSWARLKACICCSSNLFDMWAWLHPDLLLGSLYKMYSWFCVPIDTMRGFPSLSCATWNGCSALRGRPAIWSSMSSAPAYMVTLSVFRALFFVFALNLVTFSLLP